MLAAPLNEMFCIFNPLYRFSMGSLFVAILVIIVLVSLYYKSDGNEEKEQTESEVLARLKARYQQALKQGDKATAAQFGRDYYSYLRNSRTLPADDEEAIMKDVNKMEQGK